MKIAVNFDWLNYELWSVGFKFVSPSSPSSGSPLGAILSALIPYLFVIAGLLLLLFLLYGGFTYLTSAGDPKKMEDAKGKITGALVGFLIVFLSFWIVQIVGRVFGIPAIIDIFG